MPEIVHEKGLRESQCAASRERRCSSHNYPQHLHNRNVPTIFLLLLQEIAPLPSTMYGVVKDGLADASHLANGRQHMPAPVGLSVPWAHGVHVTSPGFANVFTGHATHDV